MAAGQFRPAREQWSPALEADAVAAARETLPIFVEKFLAQAPDAGNYRVRVPLDAPGHAFRWLRVWFYSGGVFSGEDPVRLADIPAWTGSEPSEKVSDWSYEKDGRVFGAYTTRAFFAHLARAYPEREFEEPPFSAEPLESDAS